MVVGAPDEEKIYVYDLLDDETWGNESSISSPFNSGAKFGFSVAIDGVAIEGGPVCIHQTRRTFP